LGAWEGREKNGAIYILRFASNHQWESHIEENGTTRPHYKGTYETDGSRVNMKVTQEPEPNTLKKWRQEKGNMPANIRGALTGQILKVGDVLTDAELKRRNSLSSSI